jgi:DNA polymerase-4
MSQARRLAPGATVIPPDFDAYTDVSAAIVKIFDTVSPVVESASIDEAYLDLTGSVRMFGTPSRIGEYLRATVADEQQITCSVGIGPTKFVAKIGSRTAKPDGLVEVRPDEVAAFLHPKPVEAMWGIGASTAETLHRLGLFTVGDLAATPVATLQRAFGPHHGAGLAQLAWGRDGDRVVAKAPERSVGSQQTFGRDSDDPVVIRRELLRMSARTAYRMRKARLLGRTVTISVRFADFTTITRSSTVPSPTDVTDEIHAEALRLYDRLRLDQARIRRVGVKVAGLVDRQHAYQQPTLTDPDRGWREAEQAADAVIRRFGPKAVERAVLAGGPRWDEASGAER